MRRMLLHGDWRGRHLLLRALRAYSGFRREVCRVLVVGLAIVLAGLPTGVQKERVKGNPK
jgi:hypothetical protein